MADDSEDSEFTAGLLAALERHWAAERSEAAWAASQAAEGNFPVDELGRPYIRSLYLRLWRDLQDLRERRITGSDL